MAKNKFIWLPFDGLLRVWKSCFKDGTDKIKDKLNELDDTVTLRPKRTVKGQLFIQLNQQELDFLRNTYELEI